MNTKAGQDRNFGGGCLCGAVRYIAKGHLRDASYCHCSICRRLTGSAFGAYGTVDGEGFHWSGGSEALGTFQPTPATTRFFCRYCGSFLATRHVLEPDCVFLSLGTLDDGVPVRVEYQQFSASKARWHALDPSLPAHEHWPCGPA